MYFISDLKGIAIVVATRPDRDSAFGGYTALSWPSSSTWKPNDPFATADGSTLYFWAGAIRSVSRSDPSVLFDPAAGVAVPNVDSKGDAEPFIASDGSLWFSSTRGSAYDDREIYRAATNGNGFDAPVRVDELGSARAETLPVLSPDRKEIYFGSDRGFGAKEIWMATRASSSDRFSVPVLAPNLGSSSNDEPSWISPDGCRLYFHSGRLSGSDIFMAARPL